MEGGEGCVGFFKDLVLGGDPDVFQRTQRRELSRSNAEMPCSHHIHTGEQRLESHSRRPLSSLKLIVSWESVQVSIIHLRETRLADVRADNGSLIDTVG